MLSLSVLQVAVEALIHSAIILRLSSKGKKYLKVTFSLPCRKLAVENVERYSIRAVTVAQSCLEQTLSCRYDRIKLSPEYLLFECSDFITADAVFYVAIFLARSE